MDYVEQYAEMFRSKNRAFAQLDGQLFIRKDRWIAPLGPVSQAYRLNRTQCRSLLRALGGLWVMWTDGFESSSSQSDWYAVVCRRHRPVEEIADSRRRSEIRRALRECEVRKVDAMEIAAQGYDTYCAALQSYGTRSIPSREEFRRRVKSDAPFPDLRHQWGVYRNDVLIGFAQNLVYGRIEVDYTLIKLHPEHRKHYPVYALIHAMNEYYLGQQGFEYVNDGFRSVFHDTGIQDFLIKKFGFEKVGVRLHAHYRPMLGAALHLARPWWRLLAARTPRAAALFEMDRACTPQMP